MQEQNINANTGEQKTNKVEEFVNDLSDFIKKKTEDLEKVAKINYVIFTLGLFFPFGVLIGTIIAYIYRAKAIKQNTPKYLIDNFTWQIRIFWGLLLITFLSLITVFTVYGTFFFIMLAYVWSLYRLIRGWRALQQKKELYR